MEKIGQNMPLHLKKPEMQTFLKQHTEKKNFQLCKIKQSCSGGSTMLLALSPACLCCNLNEFKRTEEAAARYSVGAWDEMRALPDLLWIPIHPSVVFYSSRCLFSVTQGQEQVGPAMNNVLRHRPLECLECCDVESVENQAGTCTHTHTQMKLQL